MKNYTIKSGLVLSVEQIQSGNWDVTIHVSLDSGTVTVDERHQSQRASMCCCCYHNRGLTLHPGALVTYEEIVQWEQEYTDEINDLVNKEVSFEFVNGNRQGMLTERGQDLKDILAQSVERLAKTEYADYSELDRHTIADLCIEQGVHAESTEEQIEFAVGEITNTALGQGCIAAYVEEMVRGYIEYLKDEQE